MELVSVGDYKKKWAKYLAASPENLVKAHQMVFGTALDIELYTQSLAFPFVDKNPIIIEQR